MKNYISEGKVIKFTASADISSGDLIVIGNSTAAVSTGTFKTGEEGEAMLEGVFELPKQTGKAWSTGDKVGVKLTGDKLVTHTSGGDAILIGRAFNTVVAEDTTCIVKLDGTYGIL